MILDISKIRIFIRPGFTDMRNAINGLSFCVENEMLQNPFSGSLFLFCNRQKRILKAIWWDSNGFCLCQKRLEKDHFPWQSTSDEVQELTRDELLLLLKGINFFTAHKPIYYTNVS